MLRLGGAAPPEQLLIWSRHRNVAPLLSEGCSERRLMHPHPRRGKTNPANLNAKPQNTQSKKQACVVESECHCFRCERQSRFFCFLFPAVGGASRDAAWHSLSSHVSHLGTTARTTLFFCFFIFGLHTLTPVMPCSLQHRWNHVFSRVNPPWTIRWLLQGHAAEGELFIWMRRKGCCDVCSWRGGAVHAWASWFSFYDFWGSAGLISFLVLYLFVCCLTNYWSCRFASPLLSSGPAYPSKQRWVK